MEIGTIDSFCCRIQILPIASPGGGVRRPPFSLESVVAGQFFIAVAILLFQWTSMHCIFLQYLTPHKSPLWKWRRSLSRHALLILVRALIVSKVDYYNSVLAGIPGQLQDRLQSVFNAAARLVYSARRSWRITPLVRELRWLRVPERVTFRLCVLAYRCLHGTAPAYLAESLHRTSNVDTRRRLRSADSAMLVIPSSRRSTLGDCAFPVASAHAWNSLPSSVTVRNAPSLLVTVSGMHK